jgi:nucleoid-associated protein YgaU
MVWRRSIELLYDRTGVPSNERLRWEADVRATVAERADRTSATVGRGPGGVMPRTTAARPAAPGRRAAGQEKRATRPQGTGALRLVAADGRVLPRPPAAAQQPRAQQPRAQQPRAQQRHRPAAPLERRAACQDGERAGRAARTPLRLTRRGRIVVTAAAVLAIGAASIAVSGAAQATGHSSAPAGSGGGVTRVEIRSGESLWSVAEAYDPDADTRVVIREIQQMNSLTSDQVQPGQVLWVPRD